MHTWKEVLLITSCVVLTHISHVRTPSRKRFPQFHIWIKNLNAKESNVTCELDIFNWSAFFTYEKTSTWDLCNQKKKKYILLWFGKHQTFGGNIGCQNHSWRSPYFSSKTSGVKNRIPNCSEVSLKNSGFTLTNVEMLFQTPVSCYSAATPSSSRHESQVIMLQSECNINYFIEMSVW